MKRAYSTPELLTVLLIITIIAAIMLPVVRGAKDSTFKTVCASNMHQIYLAAQMYENDYGDLPPGLSSSAVKKYYPVILLCPKSRFKNQPQMRSGDYTFLGSVAPQDREGVDKCKAVRGPSIPLIYDENHAAFNITPEDKESRFLLIRRDGSFDSVLAAKVFYGTQICSEFKVPYFYNL